MQAICAYGHAHMVYLLHHQDDPIIFLTTRRVYVYRHALQVRQDIVNHL